MSFTEKLRAREPVLGMMNFSGSAHMLEILAVAGFDHVMIDTEHTEFDLRHAAELVRAADSFGIAPLIRVYEPSGPVIAKAFDCGAKGVIVPRINTAAGAEAALRAAWYPPHGSRGMCPDVRASRYDMATWVAYAQTARSEIAVIPLIEDRAALHEIDAICAIDGIDAVFFGPGDYGASIGAVTAGFTAEIEAETMAALRCVSEAASRHGVSLIATPISELTQPNVAIEALIEAGATGIMYATDTMVFHAAARAVAETFQQRMGATEAPQAKTA